VVEGGLHWGGKDPLTVRLANELVFKLSDTLNLDEVLSFDLLEGYFFSSDQGRRQFMYLITIDQNISKAEGEIP
jgi:hypothetical protein